MKTRHLLFGIIMILLIGCNTSDSNYKKYIGKEYRSLLDFKTFSEFKDIGGTLIESLDNVNYGLSYYKKDTIRLVVFEKVNQQSNGKATKKMIDILDVGKLKENESINYGYCRLNGKQDSEIIAIYKFENIEQDIEFYPNVIKAWRANRKTGKIETIDTKGVDCINIYYGN